MKNLVLLIASFLISGTIISFGQSMTKANDDNQKEARRIWELAIEAKGGRAKLYSVRNIVVSANGNSGRGFKKFEIHLEDLYVFPNKHWSWIDQRPSIFGLRMSMRDWKTGKTYTMQFGSEQFKGLSQLEPSNKDTNLSGITPDLLLETEWNKPIPKKITTGRVEGKSVLIVQTDYNDAKIDFSLDAKTYLPIRIRAYKGNSINSIRYSDYVDVNGIKMPSVVVFENSDSEMKYKRSYQFDVKYDESIFIVPPSFEAGRQAWKLK